MLVKTLSVAAILAVASQAVAEPRPYKPVKMSMSVRDVFGVMQRDENGYTPTQSLCGVGTTCADACGAGYEQCASTDKQVHCFNPTAQQACCPDGTGNSCDEGYYCAADSSNETFCCPHGMGLTDCASAYSVTGALHSETLTPTSSSVSSTSAVSTTSSSSSSLATSSVIFDAGNSTTVVPTGTIGVASSTLAIPKTGASTATAKPSTISVSGGSSMGPAGALAAFAAAAAAAAALM